ncbi:MAG: hypothetical protein GY720_09190 [bacterium]|nr:hypothetical protein [bacterium]
MQRGRLIILIAAIGAAGSLLLPYFAADALGSISGIAAAGGRPVIALLAAAFVAVAGDRGDSLSGIAAVAAAAAVTLALILTGALLIDARLADRDAAIVDAAAEIGSGLWVMTGAAVTALAGLVVGTGRRLN